MTGERAIGCLPEEIRTSEPTRTARLKWVIVVDAALAAGRAVNAAACVAAATESGVAGLLGPPGADADHSVHPGLPWAGCSILGATAAELAWIRTRAVAAADVFVADMPDVAQRTRVYDEYLGRLSQEPSAEITYCAVSLVGPRNQIDKWVKRLTLLP